MNRGYCESGRARFTAFIAAVILFTAGYLLGTRSEPGVEMEHAASPEHTDSQGAQLWTCSMHPQVIQDKPGVCPICHMELTPLKTDTHVGDGSHGAAQSSSKERKIKYWWDPMLNPPYISDNPGKSPMGMDLVPVYDDEAPSIGSAVTIDPAVVQNMGIRTELVKEGPSKKTSRLFGTLEEAQPNIREINLLIDGWIRKLYANTEGMHLKEGDPLFDLYSPTLQVGIQELITARRAVNADKTGPGAALYEIAQRKLQLWGLSIQQIGEFARLDKVSDVVTFRSPVTGHLIEKPIVEGSAVKAGERVFRVVDHSTLWIQAQAFQQQLPLLYLGQRVRATVNSMPGEFFEGVVSFIHPHVDMATRTASVRFSVANSRLRLRPGMYASVSIDSELSANTLLVPREAVIDTGEKQLAFVALGGGHFEPRLVITGHSGYDDTIEIQEGLKAGERVVTSGQFLLDSESRLKEAVQKFLSEKKGGHS